MATESIVTIIIAIINGDGMTKKPGQNNQRSA